MTMEWPWSDHGIHVDSMWIPWNIFIPHGVHGHSMVIPCSFQTQLTTYMVDVRTKVYWFILIQFILYNIHNIIYTRDMGKGWTAEHQEKGVWSWRNLSCSRLFPLSQRIFSSLECSRCLWFSLEIVKILWASLGVFGNCRISLQGFGHLSESSKFSGALGKSLYYRINIYRESTIVLLPNSLITVFTEPIINVERWGVI
jgi:hypothetical protein